MARRKTADATIDAGDVTVSVVDVDEAEAHRAGQPQFDTVFLDELPENDKRRGGVGRGPSTAYKVALDRIRDEGRGAWGSIAVFQTATGAATALRNIKKGNKIVPDDIEKFEFQTRRQSDETGKRLSVLFARYTG